MANMWIQTIVTVARFGYHIVRATNSLKLFTGPLLQTLLVPHDFHWSSEMSKPPERDRLETDGDCFLELFFLCFVWTDVVCLVWSL